MKIKSKLLAFISALFLAGSGTSNAFEEATHFFINLNPLPYAIEKEISEDNDSEESSQLGQLSKEIRHYYVDASREEGEEELKKLMHNEYGAEEAWFYVKGKLRNGMLIERWFECGEGETTSLIRETVNPGLVIDYFTNIENFIGYHIHPICQAKAKTFCTSNFPSMDDLYAAFALKRIIISEASERGVPIKRISSGIVTPIGVYDVDVPEINDNNQEEIKSRIINYAVELLLNNPDEVEENLDSLLKKLGWIKLRRYKK
ncbi:MAG: hypothetical protein QXE64_02270 [Candidatus Pacearchaeota archaeon]